MGLVALTENLILLQFEFCIDYDAEDGGKVLLKRNDVEACCLLTKTSAAQSEFTAAAVPASAKHESGTTSDFLERVSNRKVDSYVKLNVKMADYYRIKDSAETENAEE